MQDPTDEKNVLKLCANLSNREKTRLKFIFLLIFFMLSYRESKIDKRLVIVYLLLISLLPHSSYFLISPEQPYFHLIIE